MIMYIDEWSCIMISDHVSATVPTARRACLGSLVLIQTYWPADRQVIKLITLTVWMGESGLNVVFRGGFRAVEVFLVSLWPWWCPWSRRCHLEDVLEVEVLLKVQEVEVLEVLLLTLSMFLKTVILCASLALPSGSAYVFSLSELSSRRLHFCVKV